MKNEKVTQLVLKLIKLTKNTELVWQSYLPEDANLPNEEVILDKVYHTTIQGKQFQLYKFKFKYHVSEYEFEWLQRVRLELLDPHGAVDFAFKYENSMNDLYDIVRESASNVNDFIDEILKI